MKKVYIKTNYKGKRTAGKVNKAINLEKRYMFKKIKN